MVNDHAPQLRQIHPKNSHSNTVQETGLKSIKVSHTAPVRKIYRERGKIINHCMHHYH